MKQIETIIRGYHSAEPVSWYYETTNAWQIQLDLRGVPRTNLRQFDLIARP